ncbi:MAG: hypothetical protein H8D23_03920 [Candidatus Brocadiales bacterium]|nr:hypothetical protein [Candidatus Brocadiales bacterium]
MYKNLEETQTLNREASALVWVVSDGYGCPPYTLTVSGTGFHFESQIGPTTVVLDNDFKTVELWADDTACGAAEIIATDTCGKEANASVRCSSGSWQNDDICNYCNGGGWPQGGWVYSGQYRYSLSAGCDSASCVNYPKFNCNGYMPGGEVEAYYNYCRSQGHTRDAYARGGYVTRQIWACP